MIDNNNLIKLFVRVPNGVAFNGAEVSTATGNDKKIYFDENDQILWVKGRSYGLTADQGTALATLIGEDTDQSVRAIAQNVVNKVMDWQGEDADTIINTLKEVLTWFQNLPEGESGALALVNTVGKPSSPAVLYADYEEYNTANGTELTAEQFAELSDEQKTKTPAVAATGLYAQIETAVAGGVNSACAKSGEVLIDAAVSGNKVEVESTTKLKDAVSAAETSIQTIGVAGITASITGAANAKHASIAKADLQTALFTNFHVETPLSYSYLGVTVSAKESYGELTELKIDPSELVNRVSALEEFDPWEEYSAS